MSTKSLENEAKSRQIAAEHSKMTPNRRLAQQNGPKLMEDAEKLHQIIAERSKTAPN